jgi:hypothetical protein
MILTNALGAAFCKVIMDIAGPLMPTEAERNCILIIQKTVQFPYSLLFSDIPYANRFIRDFMSLLLPSQSLFADQGPNV